MVVVLTATPVLAEAITLNIPGNATLGASTDSGLTSYALPTGAFANGTLPTQIYEGARQQSVWRLESPGYSTLQILQPLRAQLLTAGFQAVFECETHSCGGFDFRFNTEVLPEPEMHVDLGDFRFFAAKRGAEAVSLMVSRSAEAGFVQMIHIGGDAGQKPVLARPEPVAPAAVVGGVTDDLGDIGKSLINGGAIALDDLVFTSGSSALDEGQYASLAALADWLANNPGQTIALVGHTDASGGLDSNIALSRKRAESVRQRLMAKYGIPETQVQAQGVGYLAPRATNTTDAGRLQNRRVEVILTSTQPVP